MEFLREAIVYFILFLGSFGILKFLASRLTANNIPQNLRGHTSRSITTAIVMLVFLFMAALTIAYLL